MKILENQIHEILQNLQCNLKTFINRETYEIKPIIVLENPYFDQEF